MNDGLAFPFILLAVALAQGGSSISWIRWVGIDLVGELLLGTLIGWVGGRLIGWAMFRLPRLKLSDTGDGLVAVGVTLVAYATAQALHANGFVTVFVAAVTIRASAPEDAFHHAMSEFAEQIERVLVMLVLVIFGWGLAAGLLSPLTWSGALVGLSLIFLLRPLSAWIGFLGAKLHWQPKVLMAFFGIRGIGTLYYLQYGFNHATFEAREELWAVAAFAILISILLHGTTSTPLMRLADRFLKRQKREAREQGRAVTGNRLVPNGRATDQLTAPTVMSGGEDR